MLALLAACPWVLGHRLAVTTAVTLLYVMRVSHMAVLRQRISMHGTWVLVDSLLSASTQDNTFRAGPSAGDESFTSGALDGTFGREQARHASRTNALLSYFPCSN